VREKAQVDPGLHVGVAGVGGERPLGLGEELIERGEGARWHHGPQVESGLDSEAAGEAAVELPALAPTHRQLGPPGRRGCELHRQHEDGRGNGGVLDGPLDDTGDQAQARASLLVKLPLRLCGEGFGCGAEGFDSGDAADGEKQGFGG
jgi:hypothetical protein